MIIAIKGCNGAGKDTAAEILNGLVRYSTIKKFATIPNDMYYTLTGINYGQISREEKEIIRPDFISFCEGMKKYRGQDVFADALINKYKQTEKGNYLDIEIHGWGEAYRHPECYHCKEEFMGWKRQKFCRTCIEDSDVRYFPTWIISDLRFRAEYYAIMRQTKKFYVLNICRDNCNDNISDLDSNINSYTIYNNSTKDDLKIELMKFIEYFRINRNSE